MTILISSGMIVAPLIVLLLVVLRLRSARHRWIAMATCVVILAIVASGVGWREYHKPEREYGRQIDRAVSDLGDKYVLFRSLGSPASTTFDRSACDREAGQEDHRFVQRTWRLIQPVDFPTLEAALERDGFETSPVSNRSAVAYGFLANRENLAIQVQSLGQGTEVRFYYGPCVPRPTIELAGQPLVNAEWFARSLSPDQR